MSNDLMNLHIEDGEPFGGDEGIIEISDRYADVIRDTRKERDQLRAEVENERFERQQLAQGWTKDLVKNEQLRTELAWCVEGLESIIRVTGEGSGPNGIAKRLLKSLSKSAHLDAEILRCAERISRDYNTKTGIDPSIESLIIDLDVAVRARQEVDDEA